MERVIGAEDFTQVSIAGGHIGLFVSRAREKLRDQIVGWLETR